MTPDEIRAIRRFTVQFAYQLDVHKEGTHNEQAFRAFCEQQEIPTTLRPFVEAAGRELGVNLATIDKLIETNAHNWKIERLAKVELAVLRVGSFELQFRPDIPLEFILADCTEIAKEFGSGNSGAFVNGVLDAIAHILRPGKKGTPNS